MYEEFFGLKRPPFRITPDTSLFYDGGHRGDILGALVYAVHRGEGIIKVVGEVGSGKTMLCRMLQLELPETIDIIYIANPSVSADDILFVIASELKFNVSKDASKHELVSMLQHYLLEKHAEGRQVVLFVEEAQGMPLETLEEIRLLSNLETDQDKLLQIILFGQPELDQNLSENSIRQLRERITHDFTLKPLSADEIHKYLNFRMREVGYTGPELINEKLASQLEKHSQGLLRRINILADKMLLAAFADETHTLTPKHLMDAVKDSGFSKIEQPAESGFRWWAVAALLLVLVAVGLFLRPIDVLDVISASGDQGLVENSQPADTAEVVRASAEAPVSAPVEEEPIGIAEPDIAMQEDIVEIVSVEVADISEEQVQSPSGANLDDVQIPAKSEQTSQLGVNVTEIPKQVKKTEQIPPKLDKVNRNQPVEIANSSDLSADHLVWLEQKINKSKDWLRRADSQGVSIQVMMRSKSAALELAKYLQSEWPLDLEKTYLYEVTMKDKQIYRVFYDEYPTISQGQVNMKKLPEAVKVNSPYLHSIYRMQKALL